MERSAIHRIERKQLAQLDLDLFGVKERNAGDLSDLPQGRSIEESEARTLLDRTERERS